VISTFTEGKGLGKFGGFWLKRQFLDQNLKKDLGEPRQIGYFCEQKIGARPGFHQSLDLGAFVFDGRHPLPSAIDFG
jgi:hypothetical protein